MKFLHILFITLTFYGCKKNAEREIEDANSDTDKGIEIPLKYAKGFKIFDHGDFIALKTYRDGSLKEELHLSRADIKDSDNNTISIPINKLICTSTTHLPALELLNVGATLVGFPGTQYISSSYFSDRVESELLVDLGVDNQLNIESIAALEPDIVIAYTMGNESKQWTKLAELQIPLAFNGDYLEETVLGRAEWIKFMGAFFDQLEAADSIFNEIEDEYLALKSLAANVENRPTVLSGIMYGDAWYMPGGKNWGSTLLHDAGGNYLWQEDSATGWIEVGFENVLDKAQNSDFWIGLASISSMKGLEDADSRYAYFKPFKTKKVYNYTAKIGAGGGYEIMELGYAKPQMVLADMIKILHPELLPDYNLYFYEALK
jgi:iron complex transport system substrate-binding protein